MKKLKYPALVFALAIACSSTALAQETYFELGDAVELSDSEREQGMESRFRIKLNTGFLQEGESAELVLPLPTGKVIVKLGPAKTTTSDLTREQYSWYGQVLPADKQPGGEIYLMLVDGSVLGRVSIGDKVFSLRSQKDGTGILEQFDGKQILDHPENVAPPVELPSPRMDANLPDSMCTDTAERIDLMVVYTEAARRAASESIGASPLNSTAIENEIAFAVGETNLALGNSTGVHRYNLVRADEVNYDEQNEGGSSITLLGELQSTSDLVMDEVHGWRDASKADLVSLVTSSGACGWGNVAETANANSTDHRAFATVNRSCLNTNISLAHETGHNLGALHNVENSSSSSLTPPFNYGYFVANPMDSGVGPWRTVMSYNSSECVDVGGCTRVTQFSNPDVFYPAIGGDPTGVVDVADNVRVFAQNDDQVAKYRCSRSELAAANVWGKDTWADTGLEPDPITAGESMWRSPYIWVRNSQDTTDEHHHQHEDPNLSSDPHVYIKLHNDGNMPDSGDLELYYADASTNLNSPSNWNLIGMQSRNISTGVDVFEFPWSSLPGTGHFCLLARWNNNATPLSFSSIDTLVRNNKGTIWRNVNITDLGEDSGDEQVLAVRGSELSEMTFLEVITRPFTKRQFPWQKAVDVTLSIDPQVLSGNLELAGVDQIGPGKFSLPVDSSRKIIGPIRLGDQEVVKAGLKISVAEDTLKALIKEYGDDHKYSISIKQVLPGALRIKPSTKVQPFPANLVLGGVDYIVRLPEL